MTDLIDALKKLEVQTGSLACLGCFHEHSCSTRGCAIIRAAIEELESRQWIKMTERLPPETGKVFMTDGKTIYKSSRNALCKTADGAYEIPANYGRGAVVTHWMPQPELPKEE